MSKQIAIFVSRLAESLSMDENVCFHKLQEALFNRYDKEWGWGSTGKEIRSISQYKSQLVLYVNYKNVVTYSSEEYYYKTYAASNAYRLYAPIFVNGEFKFPIFEECSEGVTENVTEPEKRYTILPARIVLPAGEYTKQDLLGFIEML